MLSTIGERSRRLELPFPYWQYGRTTPVVLRPRSTFDPQDGACPSCSCRVLTVDRGPERIELSSSRVSGTAIPIRLRSGPRIPATLRGLEAQVHPFPFTNTGCLPVPADSSPLSGLRARGANETPNAILCVSGRDSNPHTGLSVIMPPCHHSLCGPALPLSYQTDSPDHVCLLTTRCTCRQPREPPCCRIVFYQ